jgi:adenylate kinase
LIPGVRLILLGRQGAGKGTQCVRLSRHYVVPHISTGDILRAAVREGTDLGLKAKEIMDEGGLVPDDIMIGIVAERIGKPDARTRGYILDGFPRTVPQAAALDKLLADLGVALDIVLELVVDDDEVVRRLSGRRTCHGCGKVWHLEFDRPTHEGVCDRCGGQLFQRDDDKPETVAERLRVYARDTAPLIDFYGSQGKLVGLDAAGPVEDVTERAIDALRSYGG